MSGFHHAGITKGTSPPHLLLRPCWSKSPLSIEELKADGTGMIVTVAITTLVASLTASKPYLHLQLAPHMTKYQQVGFRSSTRRSQRRL